MAKKNFTISTVATAPSPATSGTSLVVAAGTGSLFALNEPAIIFPVNDQPLVANAEIVMVTNVSTDTLTITRTQESTSARTIVAGDIIIQGITAKDWNDLITLVAGKITAFADPNADRIVFWDDSAGAFAALTASTGLTLSGTILTVRAASETATGIVERATDTEFTGGSDTGRYVSPNQVANVAQTMANKTLTSPVLNTGVSGTAVLDEDDMASDSNTKLATQQSIKAYVDGQNAVAQTLTNKTIDGDDNTLSDISPSSIKGGLDGWIPAGETWTYASADDPTYTFTVAADVTTKYSAGMKIKLTQGTVKYFIITAVSTYSGGNTTITVYGGTDYDLANSAISANAYSMVKSPFGFPMSPAKWSVVVTPSTFTQAAATSDTWYNATSITIPIGVWNFSYRAYVTSFRTAGGGTTNTTIWLDISETSASGTALQNMMHTMQMRIPFPTDLEIYNFEDSFSGSDIIEIAAKDILYMNVKGTHSSTNSISCVEMKLRAECAYL